MTNPRILIADARFHEQQDIRDEQRGGKRRRLQHALTTRGLRRDSLPSWWGPCPWREKTGGNYTSPAAAFSRNSAPARM